MILELDFLQEVQILYERSVRLNRLQHSYTNRMDVSLEYCVYNKTKGDNADGNEEHMRKDPT